MVVARRAVGVLLLLVFCVVAELSAGEKVKFGHLTIEEGLPETGVITMLQDRLGFLWLGTQNGLSRYDGYSFTTYKPDPKDPSSIGGRLITALYEDSAGVLWVGSRRGGLNRFDRATESFLRFQNDLTDPSSLSFDAVGAILEDSAGRLWVGTGDMESKTGLGGLNRFDPETGTFTRYLHDPDDSASLSHNVVLAIHVDSDGQLWVATAGGGLNLFDPESETFTRFAHDDQEPTSLAHDFVPSLAEDQEGNLWIATSGGLDRYDRSGGEFEHFREDPEDRWSLTSDYISKVFVDRDGHLWVGTWEGVLHRFYPSHGTFGRFEHNPEDPYSLTANSAIMTIYEDRSDILWIGTWGGGLNKLDPFAGKFPQYGHEPDNPNSLSDDRVTSFYEDRAGNLWIGTRGGLNRHNPNSDTYTHYRHDADDPTTLGSDRIEDVLEDATGTLWVGTQSDGLDRFNPDGETFAHFRHDPDDPESLSDNHVLSLLADDSGTLWIGTALGGLNQFDRSTGTFTAYQNEDSASGGPSYMGVLYQDRNGALWIGTGGGLSLFDPVGGSFTTYYEPLTGLDIVSSIHEDSSGRLWVGTFNGGLHLFDRETGTSRPYTQADGLVHDTVYNVLEDDQGRLWIATGNGVSRFNPQTESFRTYGVADGLQTYQFAGGAIRTRDGQMLFGAKNGINAFYPDQVRDNPYPPEVVLTKMIVGNVELEPGEGSPLTSHISVAEQLTLDSDQNALSFSFAALHFGQPDQNRYAYRLEPIDNEWIQAGTRRNASYLNLDPGNYEFRVRAANGDGVWNNEGASIRVTIQPPWWRTWWAYGLFALLTLAVVVTIDRLLRRRVVRRERERAREHEVQLRTEAAEAKAQAAAAEARALRIENERTAQELEEARTLQLSMLPERLPTHPNIEIATYMKTASEVGGDYYDFDLAPDGTLTVAIGDATGHGTRAGTMVTATKVLFNLLAAEPDSVKVLQESTRVIRRLNMQNLFMALALAKLKGNHLEIAGAGMPPTLIRRAASDDVEEVHLEGAPLGSFSDFPYQVASVDLLPGDTIVMMSDGLPEMIGGNDEVFGYERLGSILKEAGPAAPQDIIDRYSEVAEGWANGRPQDDDVTMIVMRLRAA